jgi:hypothetical protein
MLALLQVNAVDTLAFLCVAAGFLVIVASVVFVIKGKAVLNESGAPIKLTWGKIKATLTSAVSLFVLGAVMIVLPFWRIQAEQAQLAVRQAQDPFTVLLKGTISGAGAKDVQMFVVETPEYIQPYNGGAIHWVVPLIPQRFSYSVVYVDAGTVISQQPFSVNPSSAQSSPQMIDLGTFDLQAGVSQVQEITPKLEVSDAVLKSHGIN